MASVCPVVGTTATVLPPNHPPYNTSDPEARCPVTNAKVAHHGTDVIQNHPSSPTVPKDRKLSMDAQSCPVAKNAIIQNSLVDSVCPVVGPVSAYLPPSHPNISDAGAICPVTNASLEHHKDKVHSHPAVPADAPVQKCPVAGSLMNA